MTQRILYLHIGTVKTGTTALQRFLNENRKVLQEKGIVYPENKDSHFSHHRLSWSLRAKTRRKRWTWPDDLGTPEQEWNHVFAQFTEPVALISSEDFFWCSHELIAEIKKLTEDYTVKLIVYWRRRDSFEDSWYNQLIKGGGLATTPSYRQKLTSKNKLDIWATFFGKENIILRPYERGQLYRGDVIADFLHHVLGLELTEEFILPEKEANTRLHQIAVEYKRMVNLIPILPEERRKTGDPLRDVSSFLSDKGRKNYPVFSPSQRLELINRYAAENAAIAHDYLGRENGQLFYDPLPDLDEEWQPYEELLEDDARLINEYLAAHYPHALEIIAGGILKAQYSRRVKMKNAALRLLPGIDPEIFNRIIKSYLQSQISPEEQELFREEVDDIYTSPVWKAGVLMDRVYSKTPGLLRKPMLAGAKWLYRKINQNRA